MKNKLIFFLCLYLASAVLAFGLILPSFNSSRQAVGNDNAAYEKDKALQAAHDAWLKSGEAAQIKQHNDDLTAEYNAEYAAQMQKIDDNIDSNNSNGLFISPLPSVWPPHLTDIDALAWERVGNYPPFNWQWSDQLRLSIDKGGLIRYENMLYVFALSSVAYWIIVIGLLYVLKQKDVQAKR
jgi:hypothetical protein